VCDRVSAVTVIIRFCWSLLPDVRAAYSAKACRATTVSCIKIHITQLTHRTALARKYYYKVQVCHVPKQYNWGARLSAVEPAGWIYCCVRCTVTAAPDLRFGSLATFPQFPAYAGAYCTQPQRDGQAELAWVAKLCTEAVIHPNANHAS